MKRVKQWLQQPIWAAGFDYSVLQGLDMRGLLVAGLLCEEERTKQRQQVLTLRCAFAHPRFAAGGRLLFSCSYSACV